MSDPLFIDLETRSAVDLRAHGAFRYFESSTTDVLMACYAIGNGEIGQWLRGDPCPPAIVEHIAAGRPVSGWNVFGFERLAFDAVLGPRYGWPVPAIEQYTDTMHAAAAMSLPRALGDAAAALGLEVQKDKEGSRLIRKFSIPRRDGAWNEPADHAEDFERFIAYCRIDVEVERAIRARLVPLSDAEHALTVLDARINSRGVRVDIKSAVAAIEMADKAKARLDREMRIATGGYVGKCSEPAKLVEWVKSQGVELTSAAKADIVDLLECDDLPANVRKALELRQEAAKTSVAKLTAMVNRASADGRIRGSFMYHGASTGRWSSTGANLANMPRPRRVFDDQHPRRDVLFQAFRSGDPELLPFLYGEDLGRPLHLLSDAIRGFVWAAPGHDLVQADYSGIEGAVIAWLAGETWKVQALFDIIADPSLPDMYRRTAANILGLSVDIVTKKHWARQAVGKISELALGFAGGVSAFYSMARNYPDVKLDALYGPVWDATPEERREKAVRRYESCLKREESKADVLSREAWIACEIIKAGWRETNPTIAASWKNLETAIREAIQNPGTITSAAKVSYIVAQGFLWARLPSGRCLAYGSPRLKDQVWAKRLVDGEWCDAEVMERDRAERLEAKGEVRIQGPTTAKVTALGVNSVTKKWERFALYGGLAMENCLSGNTDVLTPYGWKRITDIQPTDKVWDGLEWVSHAGLACQGSKMTIDVGGVRMTPEHKVWTNDGWVEAERADIHAVEAASPSPEFDRAALRAAGGSGVRGRRREEELVEGPLRLRHVETVRRVGTPQGQNAELRLLREGASRISPEDARHVQARRLRGLEQHDRPLRTAFAQSLLSVRRAWHHGLRTLAYLPSVLGGHGAVLAGGTDDRAFGQQRGLLAGELRMARPQSASKEHAKQRHDRYAEGENAGLRSSRDQRPEPDNHSVPGRGRMAGIATLPAARLRAQGHVEPVYDLKNAGPRHRFTVRGENGPIIVSNCTQATARDLLVNGMWKAENAGYPVIATVYDELICEKPRGTADLKAFETLICELPAWAEGLPLTAGGWTGKRYRKD